MEFELTIACDLPQFNNLIFDFKHKYFNDFFDIFLKIYKRSLKFSMYDYGLLNFS